MTDHRCRRDWALFIRALLEGRYRDAEKLCSAMDQLNTHSPASLYEAFPPEEAKQLADRLEIHHTPKHGSWLNQAEIELSVLARQCLSRRIAHQDTLTRQSKAGRKGETPPDLRSSGSSQPKMLASNSKASIHQLTPDRGLGPVDVQREAMIAAARWMVAV